MNSPLMPRSAQAGAPFGPLLESFVLSELSRQLTWSEQQADLSHYRDQSRYAVDAVLENRSGHVVGIEDKLRAMPVSALWQAPASA